MIKHLIALLMMLAFASAAAAQQPPANPHEQALSARIGQEINANIACVETNIGLQKQLADATAKIKQLEEQAKQPDEKPK